MGYGLIDFPVTEYVKHNFTGTAGRFGYQLDLKRYINHLLNKLGH
jgi:hypothetical protein